MNKTRALTAGVTLLVAVAAGHFMQIGGATAERVASENSLKRAAIVALIQENSIAIVPKPPIELVMPATRPQQIAASTSRVAAATWSIDMSLQSDAPIPSLYRSSCDADLAVIVAPAAMVRLQLDAPCYRNQRVTIEHAGLKFTDVTGADGTYTVDIPALVAGGDFRVTFGDGKSVAVAAQSPATDEYDRVVIAWQGGPGLHLHAFENGANFGNIGHVWADAVPGTGVDARPRGGHLTQFGNPDVHTPLLAEVYSFPPSGAPKRDTVRLIVEAEVTPATCGKDIVGQMIRYSGQRDISTTNILLAMPDCGEGGGFVVMNNLFPDQKIARN